MFEQQSRRFACVILFPVLLIASAYAERPDQATGPGKIIEVMISAPSLAGNLLGDPTVQPMSVYLPPGYDSSPDKRYPVLYLLHGFKGTNRTWMIDPAILKDGPLPESPEGRYGNQGYLKSEMLDSIIASGAIPELIIVAPNGWNAYKHSYYVNSVVTGNWEDHIVRDVVNYVDATYRTLAQAASRGLAGHSGGGNGALYIGMRNPDVFSAVYAMAPCCTGPAFSIPPFTSAESDQLQPFWQNLYTRMSALTSKDQLPPARSSKQDDFWLNEQLATGAAYSPNPDRPPLYADYLYEQRDGDFVRNESAFERRRAHSVFHMIDEYEENLQSLKGLLIDYGEHEGMSLAVGNAKFAEALGRRGIPFILEVYAGGDHGNMITERLQTRGFEFFAGMLEF